MKQLRFLFLSLVLVLSSAVGFPSVSLAQYDPGAPCGRDENGFPYDCSRDPSADIEATCLIRADPAICLSYHQRACQIQGQAPACQLYSLGANCQGGDPNLCNLYVSLLRANTDCNVSGIQEGCAYLRQQGY